jgi:hypothetical protein
MLLKKKDYPKDSTALARTATCGCSTTSAEPQETTKIVEN